MNKNIQQGFVILTLGMLSLSACANVNKQETLQASLVDRQASLEDRYEIDISRDRGGRPTIELNVGDQGPFKVVLDTGAPSMIFTDAVVTSLGWEPKEIMMAKSPGGKGIPRKVFEGRPITVGDYTFTPDHISSITMQKRTRADGSAKPVKRQRMMQGNGSRTSGPNNMPVKRRAVRGAIGDGILGFWVFDEGVTGIDFVNSKLIVEPKAKLDPADPKVVPAKVDGAMFPMFPINVAGEEHHAVIDTGSPSTFTFSMEFAEKLPLIGELSEAKVARLIDGQRKKYEARLDGNIVIAGEVYENPTIYFMENFKDINIGSGVLGSGALYYDMQQELFKIELNS